MSNISQFLANPTRQLRYMITGTPAGAAPVTWTAPSTITTNEILVICIGGGGSGASGVNGSTGGGAAGGGGGGSGAIAAYVYSISPGTSLSLTAGGLGGTSSANNPGPAPVPISAAGGGNGSSTTAGAGGAATTPSVSNTFRINGVPGVNGTSGPVGNNNATTGGGCGGAGGVITNSLGFFGIQISPTFDSGGMAGAPAGGGGRGAFNPTYSYNSATTGASAAIKSALCSNIGNGGGGGAGGGGGGGADQPQYNPVSFANCSGGSGAPGSLGAVLIYY
jgi:hypothetical protein